MSQGGLSLNKAYQKEWRSQIVSTMAMTTNHWLLLLLSINIKKKCLIEWMPVLFLLAKQFTFNTVIGRTTIGTRLAAALGTNPPDMNVTSVTLSPSCRDFASDQHLFTVASTSLSRNSSQLKAAAKRLGWLSSLGGLQAEAWHRIPHTLNGKWIVRHRPARWDMEAVG